MKGAARRGAPALLACLALVGAGCGGPEHKLFAPKVISAADLARYPRNSPERAALNMARSIQFNAPTGAARFYAPAWHVTSKQLAFAYESVAQVASRAGTPKILSSTRHGPDAVLDISWVGLRFKLTFRRIGGRWRLLPVRGLDLGAVQRSLQAAR